MANPILRLCCALSVLLVVSVSSIALGEVTPSQRGKLREIAAQIRKGSSYFKVRKFKESGEAIAAAQGKLEKLTAGGDKELLAQAMALYNSLKKAHSLLESKGVTLPKLNELGKASEPPKPDKPAPPGDGAVSFVNRVAPILVGKCGRCHVSDAKGKFSMSNFANLMKGTPDGKVIFAGDPDGSRLVEVIAEGDMPRGGGKLTAEQLATLKMWIKEGAKFDGPSQTASLASLAPDVKPTGGEKLGVVKSTGKETVSYSLQIAPILAASCNGCHFGGDRAQGRFNMGSFTSFLRGGESGAPIVPGKPAASLLVKKVKGTGGGQRMPAGGRDAFSAEQIATIEKWIAEGATYDGPDAGMGIMQVVALAKAKSSTHEELTAERGKLAKSYWELGMPGVDGHTAESENFLLMGNVSQAKLKEYSKTAEAVAPRVASLFKAASGEPLIKGRFTLFVFPQRYDYSEFGKMVEKRGIPRGVRGHWRYTIVDAYGAFIAPRGDDNSVEALIGQQLAGAYVASRGTIPPRWFSEGSARAAAAKIAPEDGRVKEWEESVAGFAASQTEPDDFQSGKLPPEQTDVLAFSYVKFLMKDMTRYGKLLASLEKGRAFDEAFASAYGGSPAEVAALWARSAGKGGRRGR